MTDKLLGGIIVGQPTDLVERQRAGKGLTSVPSGPARGLALRSLVVSSGWDRLWNMLGRGQTIYGNLPTPNADFGAFVNGVGTTTNAIPAFANIDPPRMFQVQVRFVF